MTEENSIVEVSESLDTRLTELKDSIEKEKDPEKTKQLIDLFNWTISKKNMNRIIKLNGLYDDVTDQMVYRFKNRPDQFTNSDLIDYMKAVQGAIDTSSKNLDQAKETPVIVQNNTQVNINVNQNEFDRDARQRILEAIQATLASASTIVDPQPIEVEVEEIVEQESIDTENNEINVDAVIEELNTQVSIQGEIKDEQ